MVKIQETKGRYFISLPQQLVRLKQWSKGQELALLANDKGEIILRAMREKV